MDIPLMIGEIEIKAEAVPVAVEYLLHLRLGEIKAKVEYKLDYFIVNKCKFDVEFK